MTRHPRYLIVNADDFGMSRGISDGILDAYRNGIVTSTSIMVDGPAAIYAARLASKHINLTVGLHGVLSHYGGNTVANYQRQLDRQLKIYRHIFNKKPTHFDLHGVPSTTRFMAFATTMFIRRHNLHFRGEDNMNVIKDFYGMRGGQPAHENINVNSLKRKLRAMPLGVSCLVCHPGRTNNRLTDIYRQARNLELDTLTSRQICSSIEEGNIILINHKREVKIE